MTKNKKETIDTSWLIKGVCDAVRKRRIALGISQEELSKRCGLHRTYISDVERGARNMSLKSFQRLAEALDLVPSQLIAEAECYKLTSEKTVTKR